MHGQVYHHLDQLVYGQEGPRHMHLYFYDTDETIWHRIQWSPNLDEGVIKTVLRLLEDNTYVRVFWSLGNVANLDEYRLELNTDIGVNQRRYNTPTVSQVAAIWEEGSDTAKQFERSIMVCGTSGEPQYVKAYHRCYEPLLYPLFFPCGESGWN
jgi:hypothetical protein